MQPARRGTINTSHILKDWRCSYSNFLKNELYSSCSHPKNTANILRDKYPRTQVRALSTGEQVVWKFTLVGVSYSTLALLTGHLAVTFWVVSYGWCTPFLYPYIRNVRQLTLEDHHSLWTTFYSSSVVGIFIFSQRSSQKSIHHNAFYDVGRHGSFVSYSHF